MNIEKEIKLLKDQVKLLKSMVNGEDFPFFMFALDFNLEEAQMKAILKVLSAFKKRLDHNQDLKATKEDYLLLEEYGISRSNLMAEEPPSIKEFDEYLINILGEKSFKTKYLLNSIKKQHLYSDVCSYLLEQLN